jgi:hypothetical protein
MRDEKFTLSIYERPDGAGGTHRFWTLARDTPPGEKPFLIGGTMRELVKARELIDRADRCVPREPERELPTEAVDRAHWFAAVRLVKLAEGGAVGQVEAVFPDHDRVKATEFVDRRPGLALLPNAFRDRPEQGQAVFIPEGLCRATDRQIAELHWQRENGEFVTWGAWMERHSGPHKGQVVTVGAGRDYRAVPEPRPVTPLGRTIEPGVPENPVFVVVERDARVFGRGRVVDITAHREQASEQARRLDSLAREQAQLHSRWNTLALSP